MCFPGTRFESDGGSREGGETREAGDLEKILRISGHSDSMRSMGVARRPRNQSCTKWRQLTRLIHSFNSRSPSYKYLNSPPVKRFTSKKEDRYCGCLIAQFRPFQRLARARGIKLYAETNAGNSNLWCGDLKPRTPLLPVSFSRLSLVRSQRLYLHSATLSREEKSLAVADDEAGIHDSQPVFSLT